MRAYGRCLHPTSGMLHIGANLYEAQTTKQRRRRCYSPPAAPGITRLRLVAFLRSRLMSGGGRDTSAPSVARREWACPTASLGDDETKVYLGTF